MGERRRCHFTVTPVSKRKSLPACTILKRHMANPQIPPTPPHQSCKKKKKKKIWKEHNGVKFSGFKFWLHHLITMWVSNTVFPMAQQVKNSPAMQEAQETQIQFLGQEDPLEEGTATHSSVLAWRIPWTEEPGRLQSEGSQRVRHS